MRIAHCILEPRYSGAEILVLGLVRAQIAAGVSAAVFALRPAEPQFGPELDMLRNLGCELFVPSKKLVRQQRLFWINAASRRFRPDIIFAHSALPSIYCRSAQLFGRGIPVVTVLHTDNDFENFELRMFEKAMWRRNAAVVGVSPASIRNYRRRVTDKMQMHLVPNGIDIDGARDAIRSRDAVRRDVFQASPGEIIFIQVGRISPQKQQLLSVQAFAELSKARPVDKMRLILVGMIEFESYHAEVRAAAEALGVAKTIEFLGSRKDIAQLIAGADVHLMPSGWEAHSIVALEALASGIYCFFTPIESFKAFASFPGVTVLPEACDAIEFARLLNIAIPDAARNSPYTRSMEIYGFNRCAAEYQRLAEQIITEFRS